MKKGNTYENNQTNQCQSCGFPQPPRKNNGKEPLDNFSKWINITLSLMLIVSTPISVFLQYLDEKRKEQEQAASEQKGREGSNTKRVNVATRPRIRINPYQPIVFTRPDSSTFKKRGLIRPVERRKNYNKMWLVLSIPYRRNASRYSTPFGNYALIEPAKRQRRNRRRYC